MANVAIIGSSFSECLYSVKDEPNMSGWTTEKRIEWAETEWPLAFILEQHEGHWVQLLEERYPQHEFHIFAKGGAGWEYSEITLHKVAELKFDRVIVELQEPRLMLDNSTHVCFDPSINTVKQIAEEISKTIAWQSARGKQIIFTDDVVNYIATYIAGPVYATRYRQYLLSLKNVWPKVFDKVGVWAYLPINMPWSDLDLYAEIFGDELKIFEDVAIEEWIRKDPINNSVETWRTKYCGSDRQHANEEGMKLIVDFLLKQSSIQQVLE